MLVESSHLNFEDESRSCILERERVGGCIKKEEGLSLGSGQSSLAVADHERQVVGGFEAPLPK